MLTELHRKGGCLCQLAREGKLRCPLIIRPTSEDVVTGEIFQVLEVLNPRWWLPDLLNLALGVTSFRRQFYRNFRIDLWQNRACYPHELLPWDEGSTQVDVTIAWENPPTTVFIEMKYGSELSATTSRNQGQHGYPSDQLTRNARVGLLECGYFELPRLFEVQRRDFLLLVISPDSQQSLVDLYRHPARLRAAIPHSDLIPTLPRVPFIGDLSYLDIVQILRCQERWWNRAERVLANKLAEYLEIKLANRPGSCASPNQASLFRPASSNDNALAQSSSSE